jgi:uncharacterized protein
MEGTYMFVALCRVELFILEEPHSLKRKRQIIKSMKERIRHRFGVSIAEVDDLEKWQRACLGIAYVTREKNEAEQLIAKLLGYMESDGTVEIMTKHLECEKF